ncbi:diguanylate cyclase [Thioalkalivibrio sp. K90mix]|nr:diguanylate cyclase [Thioalkalivibrio sp. K90mix]
MTLVQNRGFRSQCFWLGFGGLLWLFLSIPVCASSQTLSHAGVFLQGSDAQGHLVPWRLPGSGGPEPPWGRESIPPQGTRNAFDRLDDQDAGRRVLYQDRPNLPSEHAARVELDQAWWYRIALIAGATLLLVTLLLLHYVRVSRRLRQEAALRQEVEATLRQQQEELVRLASTDALTGVWNRQKFKTEAEHEVARAERYNLPLSLIFLDLDYFKEVNDRYGHATGDAILREMCQRLQACLRESDRLGRWGGEEFLILVPHADSDRAALLAEKLRQAIADTPAAHGQPMSISLGVVSREPGDALEDLVRKADAALYRAKARGRNRVEVHRADGTPDAL